MVKRQNQKPSEPKLEPFLYGDYEQVRTGLRQALKGPSFYALVTGASGMGKTCLFKQTSQALDRHRHHMLYLSSSKASLVGIVRFVAQKVHVSPRRSVIETIDLLSEAILAQTSHLVLWIDEADQLQPEILHEIRIFSECSPQVSQLFSVVLSGLPSLVGVLDAPALFPLKRRITHGFVLTGLRRDELEPFLLHRFGSQGVKRLCVESLNELFERTLATPAIIDAVVRRLLASTSGPIHLENLRAALDKSNL